MELATERIMHMETDYEKQFIEILRSENLDYEYVKKLLHTVGVKGGVMGFLQFLSKSNI